MILTLLAAVTAVATPPATQPLPVGPTAVMSNLYHQPAYCGAVVQGELARQRVAFHGDVPAAQYAVERRLNGCGVPTPVGYHPNLAPGAADSAPKREDAPSNRR
jgi:hypothetical protein